MKVLTGRLLPQSMLILLKNFNKAYYHALLALNKKHIVCNAPVGSNTESILLKD